MILRRAGFSVSAELLVPIHITMQNLITLGLNVCEAKKPDQIDPCSGWECSKYSQFVLVPKSTDPETLVRQQVILYAASQTVTKT